MGTDERAASSAILTIPNLSLKPEISENWDAALEYYFEPVGNLSVGWFHKKIKDYFSGFFMLVEDQIREGDIVEISGKAGEVEEVTLRYVRLRDAEGVVTFIPNGEIKMVINRTRSYAYALIDAAIAGHHDVEAALKAMRAAGESLRTDPILGKVILGDMEVWGVERWELWGLGLRGRIKVLPREKDSVRREFLKRLAGAFEANGIKSP